MLRKAQKRPITQQDVLTVCSPERKAGSPQTNDCDSGLAGGMLERGRRGLGRGDERGGEEGRGGERKREKRRGEKREYYFWIHLDIPVKLHIPRVT